MFEFLAALYLILLPLFFVGGPNGVREYLSIIISFALWMVALAFGSVPDIPMPVVCFIAWVWMSVFWSRNKENAILDALVMSSFVTCFAVIQHIDRTLALLLSFLPAPGIAALMLFEEWKMATGKLSVGHHPGGIFGNANHAGVYLALNVLTGVWLAIEMSLWLTPFVLLVILGVFYSRSRNAQFSTLAGIASVFVFMGQWWIIILAPIILCWFVWVFDNKGLAGRNIIFRKAFDLIKKNPVFGYGINSFRLEHSFIPPAHQTHRVHNDILEFCVDLGVIGLGVLVWIYASVDWTVNPLLSAQLVVGILTACLFFTFREIHTGMPLWTLLAVLSPSIPASPGFPLTLIIMAGLSYILWNNIGGKIVGLYWFAAGSRKKTKEEQYAYCMKAIQHDANGIYLARSSYLASINLQPEQAWDLTARGLYAFDGSTVLYSVYEQLSKAAMIMGAVALADYYSKCGLAINPKSSNGIEFSKAIEGIKMKMIGGSKCVGSV